MNTLKTIDEATEALGNFAENPKGLDNYSCHINITTKEKCGRCSRAIAAFEAEKDLKALRDKLGSEELVEEVALAMQNKCPLVRNSTNANGDWCVEPLDLGVFIPQAKAAIKAMGV